MMMLIIFLITDISMEHAGRNCSMPALLYLLFYFYYRMDTVVRRILPSYHPPCLSLSPESIRH